jgi:hypothetical protein
MGRETRRVKGVSRLRGRSTKDAVNTAIQKIGEQLKSNPKVTVGDFIKLLQLQKELEAEETKEIKVTWVEPAEAAKESTIEK